MATWSEFYPAQAVDPHACFLCGSTGDGLTQEHVVPKWAQSRFDLWNKTISLLNHTRITYRQLTVPCCTHCNNQRLGPLEEKISRAVSAGPDAVRALPEGVVFLWLTKIMYGLLHRELFLAFDRKDPSAGAIVSPELLKEFELLHRLLQGTSSKVELANVRPSLLVVETQVPVSPLAQWDLRDNPATGFIAVRMGSTAIVACLTDAGSQTEAMEACAATLPVPLHPVQYLELAAESCYASILFDRTPKYFSVGGEENVVTFQLPPGGLSAKPVFRPWEAQDYAAVLSGFTRIDVQHLISEVGVTTWLRDENGPRRMRLEEHPWPPA